MSDLKAGVRVRVVHGFSACPHRIPCGTTGTIVRALDDGFGNVEAWRVRLDSGACAALYSSEIEPVWQDRDG